MSSGHHPALFADPALPPLAELIDLRCCDVGEVLAELERGSVDLVHADPPWGAYTQQAGQAHPEMSKRARDKLGSGRGGPGGGDIGIYACLDYSAINRHLGRCWELTAPGGRLVLWWTWPLKRELQQAQVPEPRWVYKTGGAWSKAPHHGPGFHWAGCSEPVNVYTRPGAATWRDTRVPLRNGYTSKPGPHSEKPEAWLEEMVRRWVPPGGLVLDLYAGLGSMARAVARAGEGRRYIGAEIDPERHRRAVASVGRAL